MVSAGYTSLWKGPQTAPICMLIRTLILDQQLLKCANRPFSEKEWQISVSISSLCIEPCFNMSDMGIFSFTPSVTVSQLVSRFLSQ